MQVVEPSYIVDEKMEVEKRSSKGGFFQLFEWNVKSRKKLFSNKSELPGNFTSQFLLWLRCHYKYVYLCSFPFQFLVSFACSLCLVVSFVAY